MSWIEGESEGARSVSIGPAAGLALMGVIPAAVFAAFYRVLSAEFINWDDHKNLLENEHFRGLGWEQICWAFTTFHNGHYMPLVWLSWGADYLLWGGVESFGFHASNLLLHGANAVLVCLIAAKLLGGSTADSEGHRLGGRVGPAAILCALLFAVHPLRTESVAWATERKDLLSSFFFFATLLVYLRGDGRRWYWALPVYLAAVLSKVMVVSLPIVLLVLDAYPLRRIGRERGWFSRDSWGVYWQKLPFLALALGAAALAPLAQGQVGSMTSWAVHGLWSRLSVCAWGLVFYLWKTVVPTGLSPLYELRMPLRASEPVYLACGAGVVIAAMLIWMWRRRLPGLAAAAVCYVVILLPVLGLMQNGPQTVADRYSYLSCVGWVLLLCAGWQRLARSRAGMRGAIALAGGVVVTLVFMTRAQCAHWADTRSLWTQALRVDEGCTFCLNGLGRALEAADEPAEAEARYREALRIDPGYADAHTHLGNLLADAGRANEALAHLARAVALEPDRGLLRFNYGNGLMGAGRLDEAVAEYSRSASSPGWDPPSRVFSNLAYALSAGGRYGEAVSQARRAVAADPSDARAHYNLGISLLGMGEVQSAVASFRESVRCEPDEARAYAEMGRELAGHGLATEAMEILKTGMARFPDDTELVREANGLRLRTTSDSSEK